MSGSSKACGGRYRRTCRVGSRVVVDGRGWTLTHGVSDAMSGVFRLPGSSRGASFSPGEKVVAERPDEGHDAGRQERYRGSTVGVVRLIRLLRSHLLPGGEGKSLTPPRYPSLA